MCTRQSAPQSCAQACSPARSRWWRAVVNLPWLSSYNCPDWKQSDGLYNLSCDGLTGYGGWTCDNGDGTREEEQITALANYPGGAGGKGQRHWLGDGVNNVSGGLWAGFPAPQSEIWIRWYMRYGHGFEWNPYLMNQKIIYFDPISFPRLVVGYYGQDALSVYSYASSNGYFSADGTGWNSIMAAGGGSVDARGNRRSDGKWHLWEFHVRIDTNGADGVVELWVDGTKRIDVSTANLAGGLLGGVTIGENGFTPGNSRCLAIDYDDIAIRTTGPIGPVGPGDTLAPAAPTDLQVQ